MSVYLDRDRLLYRSRGEEWDYKFILVPEIPQLQRWVSIFQHIFPEDNAPRAGVTYRKGSISLRAYDSVEKFSYIAAAFTDSTYFDKSGRFIQHFFVYILPSSSISETWQSTKWAEALFSSIEKEYSMLFSSTSQPSLSRLKLALPSKIALTIASDEHPDYLSRTELVIESEEQRAEKKNPQIDRSIQKSKPRPLQWWILLAAILIIALLMSKNSVCNIMNQSPQ